MILAQATQVPPEQTLRHPSYLIRRMECSHDSSDCHPCIRVRISPHHPGCQGTRRAVIEAPEGLPPRTSRPAPSLYLWLLTQNAVEVEHSRLCARIGP